jgi:hypothetical protein
MAMSFKQNLITFNRHQSALTKLPSN